MANEDQNSTLNVIKCMELIFTITCIVLHYYSFDDRDVLTGFLVTGTFTGYLFIIFGVFAGILMQSPLHKRIDMFLSVCGCALFIISGVMISEAWKYSFRTRTRDLAITKAALSVVNGMLFGFDSLCTFRDK